VDGVIWGNWVQTKSRRSIWAGVLSIDVKREK
jgi:hypothetical protein